MNEKNIEDKVDALSEPEAFQSPTLQFCAIHMAMLLPKKPYPACVVCPNCMWYVLNSNLNAWCNVTKSVAWDSMNPQDIPACDGVYLGQDEKEQE